MKIGQYKIIRNRQLWWILLGKPKIMRKSLCFIIFQEVDLKSMSKKPKFPLGTLIEHDGRRFRYCKAGSDIKIGGEIELLEKK